MKIWVRVSKAEHFHDIRLNLGRVQNSFGQWKLKCKVPEGWGQFSFLASSGLQSLPYSSYYTGHIFWSVFYSCHCWYLKLAPQYYCSSCVLQVSGEIKLGGGKPGEAICKELKAENAGLVVMGSRGSNAIRRTIMGSVSDYVLHHAHVPVIICPRPHHH